MDNERTGKIQTVSGSIEPSAAGVTLPHEHLLCDLSTYFVEPLKPEDRDLAEEPVSPENLFWVRRHFFENRDNLTLTDEQLMIAEALRFRHAGGGTVVDLSNIGLARDPAGLARIAAATGLNIVMGSGYYVGASHPSELHEQTVDEIAADIVEEVTVGVDGTGVRAGIIGEIGCSTPLEPTEAKVLRAAVIAQQRTGAAINVHPSPFSDELALEILSILRDAGATLDRVVFSHVDQWQLSPGTLRTLAEAGCYLEHDTFGFGVDIERSFGTWRYLPSDPQRLESVKRLIGEGYGEKVLISHDVCTKVRLTAYGGTGYAHILENVVPMMLSNGFDDDSLNTVMVDNPRRILTFVAPEHEEAAA